MKKLIQKAVKVLAFLLVLALCYGLMDQVLKIKTDDMVSMVKLRQLPPDTVDVLLVGSSHIGTNVDNQQIFDEYGISSYNLWVGMQPIWNTYYCLKEALSAQSPQIVIAEVYLSTTTMDYSPKETAIKNVELLNLGINKVQAAFASYEKWTDAVEALWGLPYYHERYDDLTIADFVQENGRTDDMVNMEADRHYQRELEYYCNCDALTGLFNRTKFEKDVSLLNEEHPDTIECVYIDVVGLHEINNHLGHQTGDSMLCMVAGTARSFFPNDRLYRIGGDEFVILCCNRKHDEVLLAVEKLRMTLRGAEYEISVGVQQGTGRENVQNIVNRAEDAMRRDKEAYYQQNGQERRMRSLNEKLERLMQEKQDADQFIRVIAPEYIAVYLINFAQDSFRKILIPDFFRDMLDKCNGSFRRAILEYIRLYIAPEDQEEFESLTCAQVVRERLAKEGTIDEHYKRSDGMPIHLRIMACDGLNKEESIWIFAKDVEET